MYYLLGTLLWFLSASAYALSLGVMRAEVRYILDPSTVTGRQWFTDTQINRWLNEGRDDMVRRTKCVQVTAYVALSSTTRYVPLPFDCWTIDRVALWDGQSYRMLPRTFQGSLDASNPGWHRAITGMPTAWYVQGSSIALVPMPSAAFAGPDKLAIDYTPRLPEMVIDTDDPFGVVTVEPYHIGLIYYAIFRGYLALNRIDLAQVYRQMYYDIVGIMMAESKEYSGWQPTIKIGK